MTVSNFRFCTGDKASCAPYEFVYVRNPTGNGFLNRNALAGTLILRTPVHAGDTVVWTYKDSFCDSLAGCPGHAVCFENGTPEGNCGNRIMDARTGQVQVSFTVPATAKPGWMYRYFCNRNQHYLFGMTGSLLVQ
jgi:hypothetical protein